MSATFDQFFQNTVGNEHWITTKDIQLKCDTQLFRDTITNRQESYQGLSSESIMEEAGTSDGAGPSIQNVDAEQDMETTSAKNTESDVTSDQSDHDTECIQKERCVKRKRQLPVDENDSEPSPKKPKISKEKVTAGDERTMKKGCWERIKDFIGRVMPLSWRNSQRSPVVDNKVRRTFGDVNGTDVESECPDQLRFLQNCTNEDEVEIENESYDQDMDDLLEHLRNVDGEKKDPGKGALKLMDKVFTDEEMSSHCFKKANGRGEKPALDQARVKRLKQCLKQHYGESAYSENKKDIIKRCNQKCRDKFRDKGKKKKYDIV